MKNFEQRLERLEKLHDDLQNNEIPLDEALGAFEEGMKLSKSLEKDLSKLERRIEILVTDPGEAGESEEDPNLQLFGEES